MPVRADLGMVFQEGALFDSLTVRENAGYRLYEETRQPLAEVDARVAEVLGFVGLGDYGGAHAVRVVGRPAPPGRHRAGAGVAAEDPPVRRGRRPGSTRSRR